MIGLIKAFKHRVYCYGSQPQTSQQEVEQLIKTILHKATPEDSQTLADFLENWHFYKGQWRKYEVEP